jgi:hypothetical protein
MRLYGITREQIDACLERPERHVVEVENEVVHHVVWLEISDNQWKRRNGPYLQVVYSDEGVERVIISAGPREELPHGTTE